MSVHFRKFLMQTHVEDLHFLAHLHDSSSNTAFGAGWPSIQLIVKTSFSIFQPLPHGFGVPGLAKRAGAKCQLGS